MCNGGSGQLFLFFCNSQLTQSRQLWQICFSPFVFTLFYKSQMILHCDVMSHPLTQFFFVNKTFIYLNTETCFSEQLFERKLPFFHPVFPLPLFIYAAAAAIARLWPLWPRLILLSTSRLPARLFHLICICSSNLGPLQPQRHYAHVIYLAMEGTPRQKAQALNLIWHIQYIGFSHNIRICLSFLGFCHDHEWNYDITGLSPVWYYYWLTGCRHNHGLLTNDIIHVAVWSIICWQTFCQSTCDWISTNGIHRGTVEKSLSHTCTALVLRALFHRGHVYIIHTHTHHTAPALPTRPNHQFQQTWKRRRLHCFSLAGIDYSDLRPINQMEKLSTPAPCTQTSISAIMMMMMMSVYDEQADGICVNFQDFHWRQQLDIQEW